MKEMIPLSVPNLKGNELTYVTKALQDEWVSTRGSYITQFEENIASYLNVPQAVACQSGTAGLHLGLLLSGIEEGDEVIVPTLTFIAAVNPVKYVGAEPVFMDCDKNLTMDVIKLRNFCENKCVMTEEGLMNKVTRKKIKAIVVVHVFGNMANMVELMKIAKKYNLKVIEDATEALGTYYLEGEYKGKYAGTIGDFGVYSFNGNKIITTGGGGMLVGWDLKKVNKAKYLSMQAKDDEINFVHHEIGFNYRMTNIQASIGVAQLERLEEFIEIKRRNFEIYKTLLKEIKEVNLLPLQLEIRHNYWFYALEIDTKKVIKNDLMTYLLSQNIQTRPIWGLIHEQRPYSKCERYHIEQAKDYKHNIINIPCSSNLSEANIERVVNAIKIALTKK